MGRACTLALVSLIALCALPCPAAMHFKEVHRPQSRTCDPLRCDPLRARLGKALPCLPAPAWQSRALPLPRADFPYALPRGSNPSRPASIQTHQADRIALGLAVAGAGWVCVCTLRSALAVMCSCGGRRGAWQGICFSVQGRRLQVEGEDFTDSLPWLQLEVNSAEWNAAMLVASRAVDWWNGARVERNAVTLRGLFAASKAVGEDHLHLTMDVDGRASGSLMVEVCASSSCLLRASLRFRSWEGYRESRRCSRDTYPESYITKYTCIRRSIVHEPSPRQALRTLSRARSWSRLPVLGAILWASIAKRYQNLQKITFD